MRVAGMRWNTLRGRMAQRPSGVGTSDQGPVDLRSLQHFPIRRQLPGFSGSNKSAGGDTPADPFRVISL